MWRIDPKKRLVTITFASEKFIQTVLTGMVSCYFRADYANILNEFGVYRNNVVHCPVTDVLQMQFFAYH